ncbi:hypothetical protein KEG38_46100 [Polyangium jinanense]|uniref:hypothetical protein n=1 Tax=Polyangium jinanense TaxID=2829994 RepID=UPI0023423BA9|nr:hypothetical protein [Polyangium jinanense]MDC3961282.1 hypothetical protein [Polyangium jinanense]
MRHARTTSFAFLSIVTLAASIFGVATTESGCASATPCEINSDCIEGACIAGECKRECADTERDCEAGFRCYAGQCLPDEGQGGAGPGSGGMGGVGGMGGMGGTGGMGGATSSSASSGASSSSSSSASSSSASSGSGGGGGGPTKGELDLCAADGECEAGLTCEPMWKNGPKRCTRACIADGGCPSGMRCSAVGAEKYCTTSDVGKACANASTCNFGCLEGPGYCTVACATGSDCPNGYGCMPVGNPPTKVCVKAEAYCESGNTSACIVPAACDTSSLLVGACTLACTTNADCPQRASLLAPWTCSNGLCTRPPDVYGPMPGGSVPTEWHCDPFGNAVNLCNDAQHMNFQAFTIPPPPAVNCASSVTFQGQAGDACVNSCRYQGACAFGYSCTAVGNIQGGRIGLCLPTGAGEVGAACANDTQCVFGHCNSGKCSRDCTADGVCPNGTTCTNAGGASPNVEGMPFRRCL